MNSSAETAAPPLWHKLLRLCVRWRYGLGLAAVLGVFALSSIPNTVPPRVHGLDKVKHMVEYFAVGLVFLNVATRGFSRLRVVTVLAAWGALLALSISDESYQRLIPGRSFDWWDFFASGTGGLLAVAVVLLGRLLRSTGPDPLGPRP